jgi:hypothetical protein
MEFGDIQKDGQWKMHKTKNAMKIAFSKRAHSVFHLAILLYNCPASRLGSLLS